MKQAAEEQIASDASAVLVQKNSNTRHFLLAGDVGGTNTRLALYRRQQPVMRHPRSPAGEKNRNVRDEFDPDSTDTGSYRRPLFVRNFINEKFLGINDVNDALPSSTKTRRSSNSISSADKNVESFVRNIMFPFLEECWDAMGASLDSDCSDTEEEDAQTSNNRSSGISSTGDCSIACCLGVAGPINTSLNHGTVLISQRAYLNGLNGRGILRELMGHPRCDLDTNQRFVFETCVIINDFVAQGYGCCLGLSADHHSAELKRLDKIKNGDGNGNSNSNSNIPAVDPAATVPTGPKLCLGAGTGFGSCYVVPTSTAIRSNSNSNNNNNNYFCFPSEFGQTEFAPNTSNCRNNKTENDQVTLWNYLLEQKRKDGDIQPRVSVEDIVSGVGLASAYSCFAALHPQKGHPEVKEQFRRSSDLRGKVVGDNAHRCEICKRAVDAIIVAYGTAVGSSAMAFLPTGGLYITGGLLLNLLDKNDPSWRDLTDVTNSKRRSEECLPPLSTGPKPTLLPLFLEAFRCKGVASFLLDDIPLYVVLTKDAGLRGAAIRAGMEFKA